MFRQLIYHHRAKEPCYEDMNSLLSRQLGYLKAGMPFQIQERIREALEQVTLLIEYEIEGCAPAVVADIRRDIILCRSDSDFGGNCS